MDCIIVDENGSTDEKREIGSCSDVHSKQHRRSKSYTDNNLDVAQLGVSNAKGKSPKVSQDLRPTERIQRAPSPNIRQDADGTKSTTNHHRASLEKDIELLQSRLQQEKSMRIVLERAMGRISSTLSPGHRHVAAQTKELIAEIELLEEEVANREHHVLSLYRSIFDHCVSAAPSQQSSGMTSPAHTKNVRKHPSIISSAFCSSSKKFTLQPFQVLASIKDSKKKNVPLQSKTTRHASLLGGQTNIRIDSKGSDPIKVHGKVPTMEKTSLVRTLKDHLYQCPSKLSEELIKCMGAIYCWLQTSVSTTPERNRSPLLSRSSTNVILPRRSAVEDREWSCKSTVEISWISTDKNQFSRASYAINNYRVLVEQLEKVNASQMGNDAQVAFWINVYNSLIMHAYLAYGIPHGPLRRMALFHKAAYNIGGHVISANTIEHTVFGIHTPRTGRWFEAIISTALRKKAGEDKQLLGSTFSLQASQPLIFFAICSGVFSDPMLCSIKICRDSDLSLAESSVTPKDVPTVIEKIMLNHNAADELVLNFLTPCHVHLLQLRVYTAANLKEELEVAKKEFLQANVLVKKSKKVFLPKILERFAKESNMGYDDLLKWVSENVDKKLQDSIRKCVDHNAKRKTSQIIDWLPYITRFRYILTKDLTEKPWWV